MIVGGGSTGCLLAQRLVQRGYGPVALLEAGPRTGDVRSQVPAWYPWLFHSRFDWRFTTVPQPGLAGRQIACPRGRLIGGSGAINALIYLRPSAADWDRWGWCWAATTPLPDELFSFDEPQPHVWSEAFLAAAEASGLTRIQPWTVADVDCCGLYVRTQTQGRRFHTGLQLPPPDAASQSVSPEHRLDVIADAEVERLMWRDGRVTGVSFRQGGIGPQTIAADEEVVVSAGSVGSPLLLMRSGIGDRDRLHATKIRCQHHLPAVGENLQDHLVFPVVLEMHDSRGLPRRQGRAARSLYRASGEGGLASNIAEAGALAGEGDLPDFQLHFTPTHYLKYPRTDCEPHYASLAVTDLHPRSRGRVGYTWRPEGRLLPQIDPAYLSDPDDSARMLAGIEWARHLASRTELGDLVRQEVFPGSRRSAARGLEKSLRTFAQSIYHPVGTCRMDSPAASGPSQTVVDQSFRVHGIAGLRVADASVLPDLPSCNTNSVCWMIAERLARLLAPEPSGVAARL